MIKRAIVVFLFLGAAATASAAGLGGLKGITAGIGQKVGKSTTSAAMGALTKKLKKVQNEYGPIRFVTGKAKVDPACDVTMQHVASIINEYPGFKVQVDGHTDNVGRPEANLKLSQARAEAVVKYLVQKKRVPGKRLAAKGWGDKQPIANNGTAAGRAKNRRVDFTVTQL
jgi:outer membrane protein OmpA-like peptidoglycan-associated protein